MSLADTARRVAKTHPSALLPCPICASSVKGDNLATHIAKVHANAPVPPAAMPSAKLDTLHAWRGVDARAVVTLLFAMIPFGIAATAAAGLAMPVAIQAIALVAFCLLMVGVFAAWFGKIPARVALADNAIVIRTLTGKRAIDLPCAIETGTIRDSRPDAFSGDLDYNTPSVELDAGTYLRFAGSREIVVACRAKAAHLGAARGPKRKRWDVELPREAFVALQYELVERGLLAVERAA